MNIPVEDKIKLNKFHFRDYQIPIVDAIEKDDYKRALVILPRRAGKDIVCFQLAIRQALRKTCAIYYVFPTFTSARRAIWDNISIDGLKLLDYVPDSLAKKNASEMKITFINGSIIQLLGSDHYDALRGTNPFMVIFSEYAYQDPRAYTTVRPILAANDGIAIFISCVSPETLVITQAGIKRIKDISKSRTEYTDLNQEVYGLKGFQNATDFYYGGRQSTLKIKLKSGFQIECTKVHKIWNGKEWVKSSELKVGDRIPIQYGQNVFGPGLDISEFEHKLRFIYGFPCNIKKPLFFYLLGIIHGDGSYDKDKVTITNKKDKALQKILRDNGFKTYKNDDIHFSYSSKLYCAFLEFIGFKHGAKNKTFPEKLFECSQIQLKAFLQGLFDSDGCSSCSNGNIYFASACFEFARDLQVILLNFGIVSYLMERKQKPTALVNAESVLYLIEITGHFAHIFYDEIGFRPKRKQFNKCKLNPRNKEDSGNIYTIDVSKLKHKLPKNLVTNSSRLTRRMVSTMADRYDDPYLRSLLDEKFYYSDIISIEESESEVFDFVIPETHSFFSNGFISHNTPFGKNHFWDLYQLASNSKDWFCYKLDVDQTQHLSEHSLEIEKTEMSEDMFQQEYFTSFTAGVEGSYYAKYINKMRLNNQITSVPWEAGFSVHSAWDIGVRDSTSIIFFQVIGQSVRIIDCYEKNKEGLEHYVQLLQSKPYTYGKHFAPHDIAVKEWGSGMTRIEKAKELGINFTTATNLSIMDGIEAVRSSFSKIWMDEDKCSPLIKALDAYRQEYDSVRKVYKSTPLHDFSSHFADCMRYLCISLSRTSDGYSAEQLDDNYRKAMYGTDSTLPDIFRKY